MSAVTPISDVYAQAVSGVAADVVTALYSSNPNWNAVDYVLSVSGQGAVQLRWDGVAAVFPLTTQHKPGYYLAAGSIQVISAPPNATFSVIGDGTNAATIYIQAVAGA